VVLDAMALAASGQDYDGVETAEIGHDGLKPFFYARLEDQVSFGPAELQSSQLRLSIETRDVQPDRISFRFLDLRGETGTRQGPPALPDAFSVSGDIVAVIQSFDVIRQEDVCSPTPCFPSEPGLLFRSADQVENLIGTFAVNAEVPEPGTATLLAVGLVALASRKRPSTLNPPA